MNKFKFIAKEELKIQKSLKEGMSQESASQLLREFYKTGTNRSPFIFSKKKLPSTDYVEFLEELVNELVNTETSRDAIALKNVLIKHGYVSR